ncbi:MAG: sigma-70 family RNA polymerase sigma factor, partial [Actinobacteria bacterium]|nr:sigma-70 family RNA polymerase sigma factor [Actinomycetota bacterium]
MTDHTISPSDAAPEAARSDADLVLRTRSGDAGAYAELWRRHYASGISVARSITSAFDADDLVQESFARIYQAIQKGGGPTGSFRAYLFTSIRNTAAGWGRARREAPIDELDVVADPSSTEQATNDALDRSLSAQAFRSLPSRWQEVLWYSEIEQMKPAEIAPLLGMTAGATAQLAFRAREGLREAWIQAHLSTAQAGSVCEWTIGRLGAFSRGNLGARDRAKLENHLGECARCLIVAAEAKEVSHRLAFVLLPLVLGITGSGAYLAMLQSGSAPVVALAAMPSSVVQGAVVVGSAGAGATGIGGSSTAAGSSATGSGASSGGAIVTGFGALVGAGSAALVIAGAIVAAAVVPGLSASPAATSAPSAADQRESSIVAQVSLPQSDPAAPATPPAPVPAPAPAPRVEKPKAPLVSTPVDTGRTEPAGNAAPPVPPVPPVDPVPPVAPGANPGTDPGTNPGTGPGTTPGTGPGTDPGTDPGTGLTWGRATFRLDSKLHTHVLIPISGAPGATVQVWIDGRPARGDEIVLDDSGHGTADIRP